MFHILVHLSLLQPITQTSWATLIKCAKTQRLLPVDTCAKCPNPWVCVRSCNSAMTRTCVEAPLCSQQSNVRRYISTTQRLYLGASTIKLTWHVFCFSPFCFSFFSGSCLSTQLVWTICSCALLSCVTLHCGTSFTWFCHVLMWTHSISPTQKKL